MIDATIEVFGAQGDVAESGPAAEVSLSLKGASFIEAVAAVDFGGRPMLSGSQVGFHAFSANAIGTDLREWPQLAVGAGLAWSGPGPESAFEQNLVKAAMLVSLWIEPRLVSGATAGLDRELNDEIIVDYTGRVGPQRYVYFPQTGLVGEDAGAAQILFAHRLLCRLVITINETRIERVFVPLAPPGVLLSRLGSASGCWDKIRDAMARRVRALAGG